MWAFNFRRRIRRQGNELEGADFDLVSNTVKRAMKDLAELSERIGELEKEKAAIMEELSTLRKQNKHLEGVLREYIRDKPAHSNKMNDVVQKAKELQERAALLRLRAELLHRDFVRIVTIIQLTTKRWPNSSPRSLTSKVRWAALYPPRLN